MQSFIVRYHLLTITLIFSSLTAIKCPWHDISPYSNMMSHLLHGVTEECQREFSEQELTDHLRAHVIALQQNGRMLLAMQLLIQYRDDPQFPLSTYVFEEIKRHLVPDIVSCPHGECGRLFITTTELVEHMTRSDHTHFSHALSYKRLHSQTERDSTTREYQPPYKLRRSKRLQKKTS